MQNYSYQHNLKLIFFLIIIFACLLTALLIIIFYKRWITVRRQCKHENIRILIQNALTHYLFSGQHELSSMIPGFEPEFFKPFKNKLYASILIKELIAMKANLTGSVEQSLNEVYRRMKLYRLSNKKLLSGKWHMKVQGIKELAEMGMKESIRNIMLYIDYRNEEVRMEAMNALIMLAGFEGLKFFMGTTKPVSEWNQINIINSISRIKHGRIPGFSRYLIFPNLSIVSLAIKLIIYFRQTDASDALIKLLKHRDTNIRRQSVVALEKLRVSSCTEILKTEFYSQEKNIKTQILKSFSYLATENDIEFLSSNLKSFDYELNFASSKALISLGTKGIETLRKIYGLSDSRIKEVILQSADRRNTGWR